MRVRRSAAAYFVMGWCGGHDVCPFTFEIHALCGGLGVFVAGIGRAGRA